LYNPPVTLSQNRWNVINGATPVTILRTFFERKGLANEATNWLNGLSNPPLT
jgi:hypothetical protein